MRGSETNAILKSGCCASTKNPCRRNYCFDVGRRLKRRGRLPGVMVMPFVTLKIRSLLDCSDSPGRAA